MRAMGEYLFDSFAPWRRCSCRNVVNILKRSWYKIKCIEVDFVCRYDSTTGTFTVPPVEMDTITSLHIFSCFFMKMLGLIYSSMDRHFAQHIQTSKTQMTLRVKHHAVPLLMPLKVCMIKLCFDRDTTSDFLFIHNLFSSIGDTVQVVYDSSTDTTPFFESTSYYYNGFTGFRI